MLSKRGHIMGKRRGGLRKGLGEGRTVFEWVVFRPEGNLQGLLGLQRRP